MARAAAITAVLNRNPRLARTLGWALLGGVAIFFGPLLWDVLYSLAGDWMSSIQPVGELMAALVIGLPYSGALGFVLWRGGHAAGRRALGFALLAAFWFDFGADVGYDLIGSLWWLPSDLFVFFEEPGSGLHICVIEPRARPGELRPMVGGESGQPPSASTSSILQ